MNKVKIYLAGKMSGLTFEQMNGWRVKASELLTLHNDNIHVENPCSFYNFELDPSTFSDKECKTLIYFLLKIVILFWLILNIQIQLVQLLN